MVLTLSIALFMTVAMLVRLCVVLLRHMEGLDKAVQRGYERGVEKGISLAHHHTRDQLWRDLGVAVDRGELFSHFSCNLSLKWQKAFVLLLPPCQDRFHIDLDAASVSAQLKQMDFKDWEVEYLLRWRAAYPQYLVVLLVALLSGVPEATAWGIALDV